MVMNFRDTLQGACRRFRTRSPQVQQQKAKLPSPGSKFHSLVQL